MWLQQTPTAQCLVGGNGIIIIVQVDEVLPAVLSDWRCEKRVGKRHAYIRLHTLTIDNKSKRTLQVTRLGVLRQSSKVAEQTTFSAMHWPLATRLGDVHISWAIKSSKARSGQALDATVRPTRPTNVSEKWTQHERTKQSQRS